jgi:hypothetical protein
MPRHQEHWEVHQTAAPESLLAETPGGTPEGEAPTVMPQVTLGGIPGCVAPELLLAKSPGGMPQAAPSAFVPLVIAHDFAGGVTKW